jgi:cell division protein FtsQ
MKKFNWKIIRLGLMLGIVIFLYGFSTVKNHNRIIKAKNIEFVNEDTPFISHTMVNKLLIQNHLDGQNIIKDKVDLKMLEQAIEDHQMVKKADVFMTIDGVLKVKIDQKKPMARVVMNDSVSHYIDENGGFMPLSENFTARVPIISGEIQHKYKKQFVDLLTLIHESEFLSQHVIGIQITANNEVVLKVRNYKHEVFLGRLNDFQDKIKNYQIFFQKAVQDGTINLYNTINLEFTKQVVCSK